MLILKLDKPREKEQGPHWATRDEKIFIREYHIDYRDRGECVEALKRYLETCKKRVNWGEIDGLAIQKFVREEIKKLQRKGE